MGALGWFVGLHYAVVVLGLTLLPAFLGITQVVALGATAGLIISIIAFVVSVASFITLFCCCNTGSDDENAIMCCGGVPGDRGSTILQVKWIYFLFCAVGYLVEMLVWIFYASNFLGLDPINVTTNLDAFIARGDAHMVMLLVAVLNSAALLFEMRDIWKSSKNRSKKVTNT